MKIRVTGCDLSTGGELISGFGNGRARLSICAEGDLDTLDELSRLSMLAWEVYRNDPGRAEEMVATLERLAGEARAAIHAGADAVGVSREYPWRRSR